MTVAMLMQNTTEAAARTLEQQTVCAMACMRLPVLNGKPDKMAIT